MSEDTTLDHFIGEPDSSGQDKEDRLDPKILTGISDGWKKSSLIEVADSRENSFVDGPFGANLLSEEFHEKGFARTIKLQNIRSGRFVDTNRKYITQNKFQDLERHSAYPNEIAIAKMAEPVARACILPNHEDRYILAAADVVKLDTGDDFSNVFVMYSLNSYPVWRQAYSRARGTGRKRINLNQLKEVQVPSPPLSEQRKIATILHVVDQAIEKTGEIIDRTIRVRKGLHQTLFREWSDDTNTDPLAGSYPADWELKKLSDVVAVTDSEHFTPDYVKSGIPVLRPGDLVPGRIRLENVEKRVDEETYQELTNRHIPSNEDIVYSRSQNFAVASQVIEDKRFCLGQDMVVIESGALNNTFLLHLLNSPVVRNQAVRRSTGSTFSRVNLGDIRSYRIPVPSEEVQQRIAEVIAETEARIRTEKEVKKQLACVKNGLMQDLLSGTVRTTDTNIEVPDEIAQHG